MRFTDLTELIRTRDLEEGSGGRRPPRDNVRVVQDTLSAGLAGDEFYLDCIELELDAIQRKRNGDVRAVLWRIPERETHIRMTYWRAGKVVPPHEHTKWTVTAVFFNALQVTTYDFDVARRERRLLQKNVFRAVQGRAGHIYDRCIHNPANMGDRPAISIHIFNDSDLPLLEQEVGSIEGMGNPTPLLPANRAARTEWVGRIFQSKLRMLALALSRFRTPRAEALLDVISSYAEGATLERVARVQRRTPR